MRLAAVAVELRLSAEFIDGSAGIAVSAADDSGKTEFVLDAELTDTDGVVVAMTHGTYQVRAL